MSRTSLAPRWDPGALGTRKVAPYLALVPRNVGPDPTGIFDTFPALSIVHCVDLATNSMTLASTAAGGTGPSIRDDAWINWSRPYCHWS